MCLPLAGQSTGANCSYGHLPMHEACDLVVGESFLVRSDDQVHDVHAVVQYTRLTMQHLKHKGIRVDPVFRLSVITCSTMAKRLSSWTRRLRPEM